MNPSSHRAPGFSGRFGVARRDITPPLGIYARNWGAAQSDTARSVHRPLTLTVLTIQEREAGAEPFALISLDLGWWRSSEEEKLLAQAVRDSGVLAGNFILALAHTHSGPVFSPLQSAHNGGKHIGEYLALVCRRIQSAIAEALNAAQPGLLETVSGYCGLTQNRDLLEPNGDRYLVGWNPIGTADQTLLVGRVTDEDGKSIATLVNYACHPTILGWENSAISPDFVGEMRDVIERETPGLCLFLQGASGDLAPKHQYVADFEVADRAGRCLAYAVLSLLSQMTSPGCEMTYEGTVESGALLAVWAERPTNDNPDSIQARVVTIDLPLKDDLPKSAELEQQLASSEEKFHTERLQRQILVRKSVGDLSIYPLEHPVWLAGDIVFVAIPNEAYSGMQGRLREAAGSHPVFVITLANGGRGYLVPQEEYAKDTYCVRQSPFARGAMELCQDRLSGEIRSVTKDRHLRRNSIETEESGG